MLPAWLALAVFCALVALFLAIAVYGDRASAHPESSTRRQLTYALAICGYSSSWAYFGSIGMASRRGIDFFPLYLGPILLFAFCYPLVIRIIRLSKGQNITSIADFVAVRYGKSTSVGVTIALMVSIGSIPYLALQLGTIAQSLSIFLDGTLPARDAAKAPMAIAAVVAIVMAGLTMAVGTRRLAATDHQSGLMLALAAGAVVKFVAFLGIGAFVCWGMFRGLGDLTERITGDPKIAAIINASPSPANGLSMIVFSFFAAFVVPRAFYVTVVENRQEDDVRTVAWLAPIYILALCLMIMPIAAAGLSLFPNAAFDRNFTIFALPIHANAGGATLVALIGALSAATTSMLVSATAIAVVIANDLVMPFYLRAHRQREAPETAAPPILLVRRLAIAALLGLAWLVVAVATSKTLSSLAFTFLVCVIQVAPAAVGGLMWSRGTARGAVGGCAAGVLVWGYTLLLPTVSSGTSPLLTEGPLGFDVLRPTDLFDLDVAPFAQGVFWSLMLNTLVYTGLSLSRLATANERRQASLYVRNKPMALAPSVRLRPFSVTTGDLLATASLYVGAAAAEAPFREFHAKHDLTFDPAQDADTQLLKHAENLIASTIGAASSRTVISQLLERRETSHHKALRIVDDVALEVQNSYDVLQHAIDIARDGMAVFDRDLRLIAWNRAYRDMFRFPPELMRIGVPLDVLARSNAERGVYGQGPIDEIVATRLETLTRPTEGLRLHSALSDNVLEMHSVRLHNGGLFFTYSDATAQVKSEADLEAENVTLERRVRERTEELQTLNFELARAKAEADNANVSKTRFLAAASHDLLQPLNAARLYTTSLRERLRGGSTSDETSMLATHIDASLEAVEDILGALLEISHLDAGATKTEITTFSIETILRQLQIEFLPLARERGLRLRFAYSSAWITSDRRLLSRLLQNLISNAIKYTHKGSVLVGVRRRGNKVRIDVHDTGLGIPESKQGVIFREFERLPPAVRVAPGVGLGLSIVERLGRVLKHDIQVRSLVGKGSAFSVSLPRGEPISAAQHGTVPIGATPRQRSLEGLAVAAIDNERHILNGMEILLQGWDCDVATGTGLPEIEATLADRNLVPDVVLADFHIDEVDGLGVIAALRTRYGHCPAVLITADRDPSIRDRALAADVRVLNKPLKPAALRALLSQWRLVKAAAE